MSMCLVDPSQSFLVDDVKEEPAFVNPWHPNAIPPITPDDPQLVNPTGEFGPDRYLDLGAYSPAKFPRFKPSPEKKKKKEPKKKSEGVKKKKPNLKLDLSKVKQGMIQTTLDRWLVRPKRITRLRFKTRVLIKEILPDTIIWKSRPLRDFPDPESAFALKRKEQKKEMKRNHYWRRQRKNERQVKKTMHILERLQRENSKY